MPSPPSPSRTSEAPSSLPFSRRPSGERLRRVTDRFGEREALVVGHQDYRATYRELSEQVELAARALIARGVRKGDRVGIWAPNRYEWVIVQYATARVGAILVTINPAYKSDELKYALGKAGVSFLFMARGFRGTNYVAMIEEVRHECPQLSAVVVLDDNWGGFVGGTRPSRRARAAEREAVASIHETQSTSSTRRGRPGSRRARPSRIGTSSTTATSRPTCCATASTIGYACRCRSTTPSGWCWATWRRWRRRVRRGAGRVLRSWRGARDVEAERCTSLYGVPTMFIAELAHPDSRRLRPDQPAERG